MKKLFMIESIILLLIVIAVAIFDSVLQLGKLHGVVFSLYLFYASIIIIIINTVIAIFYFIKGRRKKPVSYLIVGFVLGVVGIIISYVGGRLF
ncbi:hypothetical protein K9M79_03645 [Candidatus Woesearchaeota archaeon]|nr:hypothetical protein [Candidatus Woesearchaeota archaeon]